MSFGSSIPELGSMLWEPKIDVTTGLVFEGTLRVKVT
jgi:hypothetical protein